MTSLRQEGQAAFNVSKARPQLTSARCIDQWGDTKLWSIQTCIWPLAILFLERPERRCRAWRRLPIRNAYAQGCWHTALSFTPSEW
mmetsp:Transcript_39119/g.95058  ORF Transcript_39119/g.95058 Transcript_39119/m.95058 type:complete len:86 (+) Transcript_39119:1391-1648(+)